MVRALQSYQNAFTTPRLTSCLHKPAISSYTYRAFGHPRPNNGASSTFHVHTYDDNAFQSLLPTWSFQSKRLLTTRAHCWLSRKRVCRPPRCSGTTESAYSRAVGERIGGHEDSNFAFGSTFFGGIRSKRIPWVCALALSIAVCGQER